MKTESVRVTLKEALAASEICPPDEKKMAKKSSICWENIHTKLGALFLRGDYVSHHYGGPNGMVVASNIIYSPAAISSVFLLLYPLNFGILTTWFGTLFVAALGAILHGCAFTLGVGYGFCPDIGVFSHLLGVCITGGFKVWYLEGSLFFGFLVGLIVACTVGVAGLYIYREIVFLMEMKFQGGENCERKNIWRPWVQLKIQLFDILNSPPLASRRRGDQYYLNKNGVGGRNLEAKAPRTKLAGVVGIAHE